MSRYASGWIGMVALVVSLVMGSASSIAAQITPVTEAARFSRDLRLAQTPMDVEEVVIELLDILGVPVCNAAGQPIGQHQNTSVDTCIYEIEVRAVSRAFLRRTLTPLDTVVADWAREGMVCDGAQPCDGRVVEAMLRQMRKQAELTPENWQGFLMRLIDGLGHRSDRPFNLLSHVDTACLTVTNGVGPSVAQVGSKPEATDSSTQALSAMFGTMAQQAEAEGDRDTAAMLQALQSADNFNQIMAALASGDISVLMQFMSMEDEPEEELYSFDEDDALTEDVPEEFTLGVFMPSGDVGTWGQQTASHMNQLTRELAQKDIDRHQNELLEYVMQSREGMDPDQLGATGLIDMGIDEVIRGMEIEQARANYQFADWNAQVQEHIWQDPPEDESWKIERRGMLAGGEDESTSCVFLDAIQILLLHIELLDMAHPVQAKGGI